MKSAVFKPQPRKPCRGLNGPVGLLCLFAAATVPAQDTPRAIAFVDVQIVRPENNRLDRDQTVVVAGTKISAAGPASEVVVPPGAQVIAADGRYLMSGLAEMHAHVPKQAQGEDYLRDVLFLWLANGITTIRNMNGEPAHLELRAQLANQEIPGPRLFTAGPPFIGQQVKSEESAAQQVAEQAQAGFDFLKVHMGLKRPIYDAIVIAAQTQEIFFAGHVAEDVGLNHALEAGQRSIDHLDAYLPALVRDATRLEGVEHGLFGINLTTWADAAKIPELARATRSAGVWNAPTLSVVKNFVGPYDAAEPRPGFRYMPARMAKGWVAAARGFQKASIDDPQIARQFLDYRLRIVKALHDAGAGLLLASDSPQILNVPGFAIHAELGLLVDAGLTPAQALTTGTLNPAIFLGQEDVFGRIEPGLDADLILTDQNPLAGLGTLREPAGVMLRGRWWSRDMINEGLADMAARNQ